MFHGGEVNAALGVFLGSRSVLLLDDEPHLQVRRLMLPAFHGERMQDYTVIMREVMERAVEPLRPGQHLSLHELFQDVTLQVILRAVIGLDDGPSLDATRAQIIRMLRVIQSPSGLLWSLPALQKDLGRATPWARIAREIEATDRILLAHIEAHRAGRGRAGDVLSMLVSAADEAGQGMDDRSLRDQLITLIVAGHESTATTLCWVFEEILRVPGEQDRLIAEALAVLGGAPVTAEHLPHLVRIDSAIKEVLRLHPITGAIGRKLSAPAVIAGHAIPAGVMAVAMMHLTQRRADLYPEPERFVAERFLGKKIDPYAWAPFGGGGRRCLGMAFAMHEMKVMLATLFGMGVRFELAQRGPYRTALRSIVYAPEGETRVVVT